LFIGMPAPRSQRGIQGHKGQEWTRALIVVDIQRDFCPGGALPVTDGDKIIPAVNQLVRAFEKAALPIFFTRDWHPSNHISFRDNGGPWPPHCVRNTSGASFHPSLAIPTDAEVIDKGTLQAEDAYSGFQGTDLARKLHGLHVKQIYVAGLATDYCVKNTVLDGAAQGFETFVLTDCVRGVNLKRSDSATALRTMLSRGARQTSSGRLVKSLRLRPTISQRS
jgi:nicotinamidase/pyrazinamidase